MLERRHESLLSRKAFLRRLAIYVAVALGFILVSLVIGMIGYHHFEGMSWVDAYVNAAMILGGMGPVGELHTTGGKVFAGTYAIYCGLVVIVVAGIILTPIFHRFIHRFHLEGKET